MLSLPVLAAGLVGIGLGATVTRLYRPPEPSIPATLMRELTDLLLDDVRRAEAARDEAERQADVALAAMKVLAQRLADERRDHHATKLRAAAAEERADAAEMGLGEAA